MAQQLELPTESGPALSVLKSFAVQGGTAIIEHSYFDIDYRSEFSTIQETSMGSNDAIAHRVHFFTCQGTPEMTILEFLTYVAKHKKARPATKTRLDTEGTPAQLSVETNIESGLHRHRFAPNERCYRGYIVVRPSTPATVGRSVIYPGAIVPEMKRKGELYRHIRTACVEVVNVFGVTLKAYGVPFMEQDGALLRCAHVAAWMAHYTAVLHGTVPRRPSAHFNAAEDPRRSYGRNLPSAGLTYQSQSQILNRSDLPPEIWTYEALTDSRPIAWYDRKELAEAVQALNTRRRSLNPDEPAVAETPPSRNERTNPLPAEGVGTDDTVHTSLPHGSTSGGERNLDQGLTDDSLPRDTPERISEDERALWFAENLTSRIARYLNSGMPVILNGRMPVRPGPSDATPMSSSATSTRYRSHSIMICGYLRERDAEAASPQGVDVTTLIAQDDQLGPFKAFNVRDFTESKERTARLNLVVPLPAGLWLSGTDAEAWAAKQFPIYVEDALRHHRTRMGGELPTSTRGGVAVLLEELHDAMNGDPLGRNYALRSYAVDSSSFKRDFGIRTKDDVAQHIAAYLELPRYSWIVEVLDRRKRHEFTPGIDKPATDVVCTMVLDGSAVTDRQLLRPPSVLMVHVPGYVTSPSFRGADECRDDTRQGGLSGTPEPQRRQRNQRSSSTNFHWIDSVEGPYESGRWNHYHSAFRRAAAYASRAKSAIAWDRYR